MMGASMSALSYHIVGGGITYECLGGTTYRVTLKVYRDCYCTGCADLDDPAIIAAFSPAGALLDYREIYLSGPVHIPLYIDNPCLTTPPDVCVEVGTYIVNWTFGSIPPGGIMLVYQRCCRNSTIVNLIAPNSQGSTYIAFIPPPALVTCNSNPYFNNFPPIAICGDDNLIFDHSATDLDGDSLVYHLCDPYQGLTPDLPVANVASDIESPPYDNVVWSGAFSGSNPMLGTNPLEIDPSTGLLTGFGFATGQYVVGVCVEEYRDGILLSTTLRDFQFNVTQCNPIVVAALPDEFADCSGYIINFLNYSYGGTSYFWDFGVPWLFDDTSTAQYPSYEYPDTGSFVLLLVVNPGLPCTDSATALVRVYPGFIADFVATSDCPYEPIDFFNNSTALYGNIDSTIWLWGDSDTAYDFHSGHTYANGGIKDITLIIMSDLGCIDSITKPLYIFENPDLNAGPDQYIYIGDNAYLSATGAINYTWNSTETIAFSTIPNPIVTPTVTTTYSVTTISSYGCPVIDYVTVYVRERPLILLPSSFTPNNDGINDILYVNAKNISELKSFVIYNRWGERVFESSNLTYGWNGIYNGKAQEIGTYVFYLESRGINGENITQKGNITLIR